MAVRVGAVESKRGPVRAVRGEPPIAMFSPHANTLSFDLGVQAVEAVWGGEGVLGWGGRQGCW